jgi:Putative transposase/Transposase zinc-binding domain
MHQKPKHELAQVVQQFYASYKDLHAPNGYIIKTLKAIEHCRTAYLGGHIDVCSSCASTHISYNSCRNRHCPKCQQTNKEKWLDMLRQKVVPIPYFHTVFTVPHELNGLCMAYPKLMYDLLFSSVWQTIKTFAADQGNISTGMTAVLHTWGQQLMLHPHLHCIIPSGGIAKNGQWKYFKGKGKFLFYIPNVQKVYSAIFIAGLQQLIVDKKIAPQCATLFTTLRSKKWVVYAKQKFGSPEIVIEYLGRYTHKVAISNHRIKEISEHSVRFAYKDYADKSKQKLMTLSGTEFIRRFTLHILPKGFLKIRHYGLHSSGSCKKWRNIQATIFHMQPIVQQTKDWKQVCIEKWDYNPDVCKHCNEATKVRLYKIPTGLSPPHIKKMVATITKKNKTKETVL